METKRKISQALRGQNKGAKNHRWKGGISSVNDLVRHSAKYKEWRLSVFGKDNFCCVGCGDNQGGNLVAHHILGFANYPELRFALNNGTTLCRECHNKLHKRKSIKEVA